MGAFRLKGHIGCLLLHISFLFVIAGGLLTWALQEKGYVAIAPGETVSAFVEDDGRMLPLPASLRLERFEIVYYPGGTAPRDFVSHLTVDDAPRRVSMNNILEIDGYRLYQASYDSSGSTVLRVNHDPYGIAVTYTGYALFALGGLLMLLNPRGRFRRLLRTVCVAALLLPAGIGEASAAGIAGISRENADSLRTRQVVYGGRIVTFNTLARDVVTKLYGDASYRGLTPEQTLVSMKLYPEAWKSQPIIRIKDARVREALGVEGKCASLSDLFDSAGTYRVDGLYSLLGEKKRRAVEELDEKAGIVLMLYSGDLIQSPSPSDPVLSDSHVRLELLYNSVPFGTVIFILFFSGAALAGISLFARSCIFRLCGYVVLCAACLLSAAAFAMQWVLAGRLPLSNTFETLQFMVIVIGLLLVAAARRNSLLLTLGMLLAGSLSLVAHIVEENPVVTALMPVLHSPWLSLHVSLVMTSYALLCVTFIVAVVALVSRKRGIAMKRLSLTLLYPGVWLLGLGICSGAVWANVSWGQYWSWDPKETWALITFLIYAVPLHSSLPWFRKPLHYHLYMLFAILSVAMTYFGVNFLNSMHAYN